MAALGERLSPHVSNTMPRVTQSIVTGIVGDQPSLYAKTPPLWNGVFRELGWDAVSLAWDVPDNRLPGLVEELRRSDEVLGFSVTNPFKIAILPLLDDVDPLARQIGAVNTVVRRGEWLIGFNTDGQGAIDALLAQLPGQPAPFLPSLAGLNVVMLGAGGAARAVAFYVAERLVDGGSLRIVNRDAARARSLADAVREAYGTGEGAGEDQLQAWLPAADLVINASTKGQAGWRRAADGSPFMLEPYSAFAPADPPCLAPGTPTDAGASRRWFVASCPDVERNLIRAHEVLRAMRTGTPCFDLIYAPLETRFLAEARMAGHPTLNGKWMNIAQAADGFARKICAGTLTSHGLSPSDGYRRVFELMAAIW